MQGKIFPGLIPYVSYFGAPKDLNTPILSQQIDATKIGSLQSFKIKHKYVGQYSIRMEVLNLLDRHINNMSTKPYEFTLDAVFKIDKMSVYHPTLLLKPSFTLQPINVSASKSSDYYIDNIYAWPLAYSVPRDVPVGKEIEIEIMANKDIENFYKQFGNPTLIIQYHGYNF